MTETTLSVPGYQTGTWTLDPSHSEVSFSVRHMMISKVRGTFAVAEATLTAPENPLEASVEASVDIASVNTKDENRDGHLKSPDFFDAERFPQMTFRSTAVRAEGEDYVVDGELTIKDITKPVSFAIEFGGVLTDPWGNQRAGLEARGTINREDFGLTWNQALESGGVVVGKDVTIQLDLEFVLQS